jgi:hypothetical protein
MSKIIVLLNLKKKIGLRRIGWFPGSAVRQFLMPVCKVMVKVITDYGISKGLKNKKYGFECNYKRPKLN